MRDNSAVIGVVTALLVLGGGMFCSVNADIPVLERDTLIALYYNTEGDNWSNNSGWKKPPLHRDGFAKPGTEGSWYGITLNAGKTAVEHIDLHENNLNGRIPADLGNLKNLQYLWLGNNRFTESIPQEIGGLENLWVLSLKNNQLTGSIPPELRTLSNLTELVLNGNQLTGSIPPELGSLSNFEILYLDSNQLTGSIPPELGNLSNLRHLWLDNNQLTGGIPSELGSLENLEALYLQSNELTGKIPPELGNLLNLFQLGLHSNQLTGTIPAELGSLSKLSYLILRSNRLTGDIPSSLTNMTRLSYTDIGYNALYACDDTLRMFLNGEDPDWENTQTIAPEDLSAEPFSTTSIGVNWRPIAYTADFGGYQVFYSITHGGPYSFFGITEDKSISQMELTGLASNTIYYFVVQTRTDAHPKNQSTLYSEYSEEVSATTAIMKGDINRDGNVNLSDAILALQVVIGRSPTGIHSDADVNGDGEIGLEEVIYILQKVCGLR